MSFHISKSRVSGDKERIVHISQLPGTVSARHALSVRVPGTETSSPVCIRETRAVYTSSWRWDLVTGLYPRDTRCLYEFLALRPRHRSVSARHALSVRVPSAETSSPVSIRETRAVYTSSWRWDLVTGLYARDTRCLYEFLALPTERVLVTFVYFDVEGIRPGCVSDRTYVPGFVLLRRTDSCPYTCPWIQPPNQCALLVQTLVSIHSFANAHHKLVQKTSHRLCALCNLPLCLLDLYTWP